MTEKADNTASRAIQFTGDNHQQVAATVGVSVDESFTLGHGVCVIDRANRESLYKGDWAVLNDVGHWIRVSENVAGALAEKVVKVEVPKPAMSRMMHPAETGSSPLGNEDQAELDAALYDLKRIAENVIGKWLTKQILHVARSAVATMMDRGLAAGIRRLAEAAVNVQFTSWAGETFIEPKVRKGAVDFADKTVDRINNWLARQ